MATAGSATILPVIWISAILALATVTLRICTRAFLARSLGWDDCTILLALLCSLAISLIWSLQVPYGLGHPLTSIPPEYRAISAAMTWAVLFPYYIGLCLVKASALLQMLRVFAIPRVQTACLALLSLVGLFAIWRSVTALIACHQPPASLTLTLNDVSGTTTPPTKECVAPFPILYINCGINIGMDVLITLLPLRVLSRLRLPARRCRVLTAVFALGLLPTVPSSIRLHALTALGASRHRFITSSAATVVWTALDLNVAIVCACGPALGPLYTLLAARLRPATSAGAGADKGDGEDPCTMMVLSPPASPSTVMMMPLVAGSVTVVAAGVAVPSFWQSRNLQRRQDKCVENGVGVAVTTPGGDDYIDDEDAISDLVEFADFTGLTGDASLDGFLVATKLEKAKSREELLAVARRPSGGTTATIATMVRVREVVVDCYDNDDDDDDRHDLSRVSLGVSEGRASSTIELV